MDAEEFLNKVKQDFKFIEKRHDVLGILVFGSIVRGEHIPRSDIDICIVAPETENLDELINYVFSNVYNEKDDIKFFEILPLRLKIEIIKNHIVIYSKDLPALYEYFYFYRKIWKDQEKRNSLIPDDLKTILS